MVQYAFLQFIKLVKNLLIFTSSITHEKTLLELFYDFFREMGNYFFSMPTTDTNI